MKAVITTTDFSRNSLWVQTPLESGALDCTHQVSVYPRCRGQRFEGFGGAFTEAAAYNYQKLPLSKREAFMQAYFGEQGLRYSVGRTHIGSCDFALGNYACMDSADAAVFDTRRDETYLLPMLRDAALAAGKPIGLLLSPWSPPAFMKTNGDMNHGGKLREEYRSLWASCMAQYVAFYKSHGCDVRMVSIQNEPAATQVWDSCLYSGAEEGEFAAFLREALDAAGCEDVKILAWDHNKDIFVYRAEDTLSVDGAEKTVDGFGIHWYTGDHFEAIRAVKQRWPEKTIWFTEGCVEYSRFDGMSRQQKAEMYAHDILGNLNAGISGSIDWNLLLDSKGGPNHVGNFCEAPVMLTEDATDFTLMTEYYYIGHFSRYIRPGAVKLASSVAATGIEAVAFENPDGSRAAVLLNAGDEPQSVSLTENGAEGFSFQLMPHTIATVQWGL